MNFLRFLVLTLTSLSLSTSLSAQKGAWQLWASGLPGGTQPKLDIAPNHDIFYALVASSGTKGIVYKANTLTANGNFTALPAIPLPVSVQNNIMALQCNSNSEPIAGIFRNNTAEPFVFRYSNGSWIAATSDVPPVLGTFCMAKAPDGTIWLGAKWAYVYKSTDGGATFTHIDETQKVKTTSPCYYPSWEGNALDGAIYSINVDKKGRVYAGTEGAGVVYSDDKGNTWYPVDHFACKATDNTRKDSTGTMIPISQTGNVGALGFTANDDLIMNGTDMWKVNYKQTLCFADLKNHTVTQAKGIMDYFISTGLQITKIVTTANGRIFLHSGSNASVAGTIGIYTSTDGINWTVFNTGITGANDGQTQGSLAVDGNKVYMATHDGKIFVYDDAQNITAVDELIQPEIVMYPNPANTAVSFENIGQNAGITVFNALGQSVMEKDLTNKTLDISMLEDGIYSVKISFGNNVIVKKLVKE